MRSIFALALLLGGTEAFAKSAPEYNFCLGNVLAKPYLENWQAEVVCQVASNTAIGCGMDLVDQGYYA